MTKRLKTLLLILGVATLAAIGFLVFNPNSPVVYYFAHASNFEECVKNHGTLYEGNPRACVLKSQVFVERNRPEIGTNTSSNWKGYTDEDFAFSFRYPANIFRELDSEEKLQFLDLGPQTSTTLVHTIEAKHCDLSGLPENCTNQTTDISLVITPIKQSFQKVTLAAENFFGNLSEQKLDNLSFKMAEQGAEGEGRAYYFIKLSESKTLVITRTYINQEIVGEYKDNKDFIKIGEQQKIFDDILKTLKINN